MSLLLLFQGASVSTPPPPPPEPEHQGGGGFGGGYEWEKRRKHAAELRARRFDDENEERRALGAMLREIIDPQPVATESGTRQIAVDPELAMLLTRSERTKDIEEYRALVDQITAKVLDEMAEEDDVEVLMLGMM